MALRSQSIFLYNYEVTEFNSSIDFQSSFGGPIFTATLALGSFTASELLTAVVSAMQAADPSNTYSATIDRTVSSGTQNRITIAITTIGATYFSLLWLSGPRNFTSAASLLGYTQTDKTGALTYTGQVSSGVILIPDYYAYSYLGPDFMRTVFGTVSITAGGIKEALVWQVQQFFQANFKHQPYSKVVNEWTPFLTWAVQQKPFEFTPEIASPNIFYQATLESTAADGKGLGFTMSEELPDMPFWYTTGMMKFRRILP